MPFIQLNNMLIVIDSEGSGQIKNVFILKLNQVTLQSQKCFGASCKNFKFIKAQMIK